MNEWRLGMNYVSVPKTIHSDFLPVEIPVVDSNDTPRGFARYYAPHGYRVALLPDFDVQIRNKPQTRTFLINDSGEIVGIKITLSNGVIV